MGWGLGLQCTIDIPSESTNLKYYNGCPYHSYCPPFPMPGMFDERYTMERCEEKQLAVQETMKQLHYPERCAKKKVLEDHEGFSFYSCTVFYGEETNQGSEWCPLNLSNLSSLTRHLLLLFSKISFYEWRSSIYSGFSKSRLSR